MRNQEKERGRNLGYENIINKHQCAAGVSPLLNSSCILHLVTIIDIMMSIFNTRTQQRRLSDRRIESVKLVRSSERVLRKAQWECCKKTTRYASPPLSQSCQDHEVSFLFGNNSSHD